MNILMVFGAIAVVAMWYAVHRIIYKKGKQGFNLLYFGIVTVFMYIVIYNGIENLLLLHEKMS
ncbi:hypothetical protein [Staphylococcus equorum]|uniref:hypothetical protein n=1 Tax=Staphylococcaceae TaxID=90964 RepID=UPI000853E248|nr:hypothetical protein [Staphylococcus equorum]OEL08308.1 hypothetical protein AST04_08970 [Staphylococcus equorum]